MSAAEIYKSAVEYTGDTLRPADGQEDGPCLIHIAEAGSTTLRGLHRDVAVRNTLEAQPPVWCALGTDQLCTYLEKRPFDELAANCGNYLQVTAASLDEVWDRDDFGYESVTLDIFEIDQTYIQDPVVCRILSYYGIPRFYDWSSLHLRNLHELELRGDMPSDPTKRDKVVLRIMVAAVMELERGVPLSRCEPAMALGFYVPGNTRGSRSAWF